MNNTEKKTIHKNLKKLEIFNTELEGSGDNLLCLFGTNLLPPLIQDPLAAVFKKIFTPGNYRNK